MRIIYNIAFKYKVWILSYTIDRFITVFIPWIISHFYRLTEARQKLYKISVKSNNLTIKMLLNVTGVCRFPVVDTILLRRLGLYEPHTSLALARYLRKGDSILEIGAAYGYFTCQMSQLVGPEGRVYSFEPNIQQFLTLQKNILVNNLTNVKAFNAALVPTESSTLEFAGDFATLNLEKFYKDLVGSLSFIFIDIDANDRCGIEIRQELSLIDAILSCNLQYNHRPVFFVEYIERDSSYHAIVNLFQEHGYSQIYLTNRHFLFIP